MKELLEDLEKWGADVIFGRARGFRAWLTRCLMWFLAGIFRGLVMLRLKLVRDGWIDHAHLGATVISIGNLTVGGTGKTPVTELLARTLAERGRKVAILSRGYKSKKPDEVLPHVSRLDGTKILDPPRLVSEWGKMKMSVEFAGDEPFMLARNLKNVSVVVEKDRVKCGRFALSELGADTLILDDGLQYIKLAHSIDIVLLDSTAPFGTGAMLPRGTLREPKKNVQRASHILLTKCDGSSNEKLIKKIRKWNKTADIIECAHESQWVENVFTRERHPLSFLKDKWIGAISGIAVPESFERKLEELGGRVEIKRQFSDHHTFTQKDIDDFMKRCVRRDMEMIVTTEKDAVRFPAPTEPDVPVYFLRIEVKILSGQDAWDRMVDTICGERRTGDALLQQLAESELIL